MTHDNYSDGGSAAFTGQNGGTRASEGMPKIEGGSSESREGNRSKGRGIARNPHFVAESLTLARQSVVNLTVKNRTFRQRNFGGLFQTRGGIGIAPCGRNQKTHKTMNKVILAKNRISNLALLASALVITALPTNAQVVYGAQEVDDLVDAATALKTALLTLAAALLAWKIGARLISRFVR